MNEVLLERASAVQVKVSLSASGTVTREECKPGESSLHHGCVVITHADAMPGRGGKSRRRKSNNSGSSSLKATVDHRSVVVVVIEAATAAAGGPCAVTATVVL